VPRLMRTIIPRIKKSIERRGVIASLFRGFLLPVQLLNEHRKAKELARDKTRSEFDRAYGVETDGDIGGVTYISDLDIPSTNWIYAYNYGAIAVEAFRQSVSDLDIDFTRFTFIDFGSGKGRALLLASQLPFKKIVGIEFSPELCAIARKNLHKFPKSAQRCESIETLSMDFTEYSFPPEPSVLFFNRPSWAKPLARVVENLRESLRLSARDVYIVFVAPVYEEIEAVFDSAEFLVRIERHRGDFTFNIYKTI